MKQKLLIPYTFVLMNWAAVVGLYHFLRGGDDLCKEIWMMPPAQPEASIEMKEGLGREGSRAA